MQTKHFIHDPTLLVNSALHSLTLTNPSLAFDSPNKIIYRRPPKQDDAAPAKISIISGGGSGHEPALAGLVGKGLLTASVAGTIFASPSAEQVRRAVMTRVATKKGVLILILNYTGDVLSFGVAAEKAKAAGIQVEFCAIGDDVSVGREKGGKVGRRGIAGTVLVLKMCGALAELGGTISETHGLAKLAVSSIVSVGASLDHVHVPGRIIPKLSSEDHVLQGEIELGMGIHNEPGSRRLSASLPDLVKIALAQLLDPNDQDRAFVSILQSDKIVLLVNNLGGLSTLELAGITAEVHHQLESDYQFRPLRTISGTFLTSLNGMGFSISILKITETGLGEGKSMLDLLDLPAEATGWSAPIRPETWNADYQSPITDKGEAAPAPHSYSCAADFQIDPSRASQIITAGLKRVIACEPEVTRYDTIIGDGDCGTGLKRGAEAVMAELGKPDLPTDVLAFVNRIVAVVEHSMDGTSGAIYAIFLNALAHSLLHEAQQQRRHLEQDTGVAATPSTTITTATITIWIAALQSSLTALSRYTPAQPGDRTLLDALVPFIETLAGTRGDVVAAAAAAAHGAEDTKWMKASLGRAVYVGREEDWVGRIPDPGAWGLKEFLGGLAAEVEAGMGK